MPEGPELRLAANFINKVASQHLFSGKVIKSDLATKLTEVPFEVRPNMLEFLTCTFEQATFLANQPCLDTYDANCG